MNEVISCSLDETYSFGIPKEHQNTNRFIEYATVATDYYQMETADGYLVIPPTKNVALFVELLNEFALNYYLLTERLKEKLQEYKD